MLLHNNHPLNDRSTLCGQDPSKTVIAASEISKTPPCPDCAKLYRRLYDWLGGIRKAELEQAKRTIKFALREIPYDEGVKELTSNLDAILQNHKDCLIDTKMMISLIQQTIAFHQTMRKSWEGA